MAFLFIPLSLVGLAFATDVEKRYTKKESPMEKFYEMIDDDLARLSLLIMGCIAAFVFLWQLHQRFYGYIRLLASLGNERQRYFVSSDRWFARLKNHLIYAPLFRTRHNNEFQLSRAINMGNLPSRFHTLVLIGIIAMNIVLCVVTAPYGTKENTIAGVIRNRTGTMATVNLIPLVLVAGRNNPLIPLLRVSFDTFNLIHRWLARIVVLESIAHVLAWLIPKVQDYSWDAVGMAFRESRFMWSGLIAAIAFVVLALHSPSPLRHAFYETFLHIHIVMIAVGFGLLWIHLSGLVAQTYLLVAVIFWGLERFARFAILLYRNCGRTGTTVTVEAMPGDAVRMVLNMPRPWTLTPGQHLYLYIPAIGWWTSHPLSVAWSEAEEVVTDEKGIPMTYQDIATTRKTTLSLLARRRTGFTDKLFQRAQNAAGSTVTFRAFAEGPYGSIHSMDSYGTVLLFAGGVGITHHVPFVRHLVDGYAEGTVAARRVTLVWIIQSPEHLEWIRPWMTSILNMKRRREVLRILLFVTRPRNTKEIQSPSTTVQMYPGRPNIGTLVDMEIDNQIGTMGVLVCGNGSLSDDVRRVCRKRQDRTNIDYVEESFSW
ncbi:hypothetical protein MAP00_002441 [Monascus purpureus]|nr:hypothetical protein MAP00_002441 [Monascus purpureus]